MARRWVSWPGRTWRNGRRCCRSAPVLKEIRLIITTTDGKKSEAYIPAEHDGRGRQRLEDASCDSSTSHHWAGSHEQEMIQSVAFAGNTTSTFYVGDLRVIDDSTPDSVATINAATRHQLGAGRRDHA